jgi:hypothetical protein
MTQDVESYYPRIFQLAVDCIPIDYARVWIHSELGDGFLSAEIFVQSLDGSFFYTTEGFAEISELIHELHENWKESPAWSSATFSLNSDGKFSVDFGYEAVPDPDIELDLQRREEWIGKYLGRGAVVNYSPPGGSPNGAFEAVAASRRGLLQTIREIWKRR